MEWETFAPWFRQFLRDEVRLLDVRDAQAELAYDSHFLNNINLVNRNSVQDTDDILTGNPGAGAGDASITIAAHTVLFDYGDVAYGAGLIDGLDPEEFYYVYTNDVRREGGAVSYSVTTNPDNLIGKGIYYVGSIELPVAGGGSVTSGGGAGAGIGGSRYDLR